MPKFSDKDKKPQVPAPIKAQVVFEVRGGVASVYDDVMANVLRLPGESDVCLAGLKPDWTNKIVDKLTPDRKVYQFIEPQFETHHYDLSRVAGVAVYVTDADNLKRLEGLDKPIFVVVSKASIPVLNKTEWIKYSSVSFVYSCGAEAVSAELNRLLEIALFDFADSPVRVGLCSSLTPHWLDFLALAYRCNLLWRPEKSLQPADFPRYMEGLRNAEKALYG